ncbi:MAG TPA: HAMP domain-containing sensor histidine kinase [Steroidobacteraceae bacterium]|nr:HAMP domain-containing sensor histidine kinase [Steroidobacteraceae bacterium]
MLDTHARIAALERANARLAEALRASEARRQEAERANRSKDEFIVTVSHELRTPLSTIRHWSQILAEGRLSADEVAQGAKILERSAHAQQQIVDDLLDLSRMARGQLRLELKDIRIVEAVETALAQAVPLAQARRIELAADLASGGDPVRADADRIQQVAWNLLTNAVKFTPPGGRVDVRLHRVGESMELDVRDTGIGIEPQVLPFVFDRFWQGSGCARRQSGLGLGLSIAKQLVELHGGTICAESRGAGQGALFKVCLPLSNPVARLAAEQARSQPSSSA